MAVHLACQSLRESECRVALAGGVNLILVAALSRATIEFGALSPDGRCYAWDERANGHVRGEGGGIVVLKRLQDAQAAGDRIYGVIRGSGLSTGSGESGLTVPSADSAARRDRGRALSRTRDARRGAVRRIARHRDASGRPDRGPRARRGLRSRPRRAPDRRLGQDQPRPSRGRGRDHRADQDRAVRPSRPAGREPELRAPEPRHRARHAAGGAGHGGVGRSAAPCRRLLVRDGRGELPCRARAAAGRRGAREDRRDGAGAAVRARPGRAGRPGPPAAGVRGRARAGPGGPRLLARPRARAAGRARGGRGRRRGGPAQRPGRARRGHTRRAGAAGDGTRRTRGVRVPRPGLAVGGHGRRVAGHLARVRGVDRGLRGGAGAARRLVAARCADRPRARGWSASTSCSPRCGP